MLEEKKNEVNQMNRNSKKAQEYINNINKKIYQYREKISYYKLNRKTMK